MSTVHLLRGVVSGDVPAALVTLVAYRPLPAVGLGQVVAAVVCEVPDHELAVLVLGHDSCDSLYDSLVNVSCQDLAERQQLVYHDSCDSLYNSLVNVSCQDLADFGSTHSEPSVGIGRVQCDSEGRLNSNSVILHGSLDSSSGISIPLDLSQAPAYSLFPGQVRSTLKYRFTV